MKKNISLLISIFIIGIQFTNAQYVTGTAPKQDGTITPAEYYSSNASGWYMCWDNTYLYLARTAGNASEPCIAYFDINPTAATIGGVATGANGSTTGKNDWGNTPFLPFVANARIYFTGNYAEVTTNSGSGWNSNTNITSQIASSSTNIELKISWAQLQGGSGSIPASFDWLGTESSTGGNIYGQVPTYNYNGGNGGTPTYFFYQTITNTTNTGTTNPFDANHISFSNYNNSSFDYTNSLSLSLYDLNIGNSSSAGTVNIKTTLNIYGNIVVKNGGIMVTGGSGQTINMRGGNQYIRILNSTGGYITGTDNGFGNDLTLNINNGSNTVLWGDNTSNFDHEKKFYSVNVAAGGTLALNNGLLVRYGTFNVPGTLQINTNGYIQSIGSAASYSGSSSALIYNNGSIYYAGNFEWPTINSPANVTIQNNSNVVLNNSKSITNSLTLSSGTITTGVDTISIAAGATVSRTSGWINGNLRRDFNTSANTLSLTYDVGNATSWMPVYLSIGSVTTAGGITINTVDGKHPNYASNGLSSTKYINRYWNAGVTGAIFTGAQLQFSYLAADLQGTASASNIKGVRYSGSAWAYPPTTGTTSYSFTNSFLTSSSMAQSFTGGECAGNIILANATSNSPVCAGSTLTFSDAGVSSGGIAPLHYNWSGVNSFSSTGVSVSIPNSTTAATGSYTIIVTDTAGCTATSNINATINAVVTPAVSLSPGGIVNSSTQLFTATASNTGGGVVTYTFLNNITAKQSGISNTWNATGMTNGNIITCGIAIVGGSCLTQSTAVSNSTSVCTTGITPFLGIGPTSATNASTTFTANAFNTGGGVVTYNFKKNGNSMQNTTSTTWNATGLITGDIISCDISITGGSCLTQSTASSANTVTACINPITPSVTIVVDKNPVCADTLVTFNATSSNAVSPTYSWYNGITSLGSGNSFSSSTLPNGASITCVMTANNACGNSSQVNSNTIVMIVNSASGSTTDTVICASALPFNWYGHIYYSAGSYTIHYTNAHNCDSSALLNLSINNNNIWTGATSNSWNTASNWCSGSIPGNKTNINIVSVNTGKYPVLNNSVNVNDLSIANGTTLSLSGNNLNIGGTLIGTGKLIGSATSSLTINSNSNITINFGNNTNDSLLANLNINGTGTVNLGTGLGITNQLVVNSGTLNTNNQLTLKSTSITSTAVVGNIGGIINGTTTVERYIPQGIKQYRDLCAEVANAGPIFNNWQENGAVIPNYGIYITGKKGISTGFDASTGLDLTNTGLASLYVYGGGTWPTILNTKTNSLNPYQGYRAVIRGDRNFTNFGFAADIPNMNNYTTLRTHGNLIYGNVTYSTAGVSNSIYSTTNTKLSNVANGWSMIANPYACPIDWEALGRTNLTTSYYYLDPESANGGYVTYVTYNAFNHQNSNPGHTNVNQYIQPGQAIFVLNDASGNAPVLTINESCKAPNSSKTAVFDGSPTNNLTVSLLKKIHGFGNSNVDGAVAVFSSGYSKFYGDEDSKKLFNSRENLTFWDGTEYLSINGLPNPVSGDIIQLGLYNMIKDSLYTLKIDAGKFTNVNNVKGFIIDKFLNKTTPLNNDSTVIKFTTTADSSSFGQRFNIYFIKNTESVIRITNSNPVALGPNPTHGSFRVEGDNICRIKVSDVNGRIVITKENISNNSIVLNLEKFPDGVYLVETTTKLGNISINKIIKE